MRCQVEYYLDYLFCSFPIDQNRDLPEAVIAEIPMVKAAIEYNFSCEETKKEECLTESQLARIPTPFR